MANSAPKISLDDISPAEARLFALFDQLGVVHETFAHPPLFTVEEGREWHDKIPGLHCKNLFLKDKKDKLYLAVLGGDKRAKLGALEKRIGAARLSFGREELLKEVLGIPAGSVTPFALINDTSRQVLPILDEEMMKAELVNYHPLRNDRTTVIKSADLLKFLQHLSYRPLIENCGE